MSDFKTYMSQWTCELRSPCIACLGDSVTAGFTGSGVLEHDSCYVSRLRKLINENWPLVVANVINAGVGGDTARAGLARLERDVLTYQPTVLIVAFGLNDTGGMEAGMDRFKSSLEQIVTQARDSGVKWIVLVTPPMMATQDNPLVHANDRKHVDALVKRQTTGILKQYAQAVRDVAMTLDVSLADVHAQWETLASSGVDTNSMLANGLNHPTAAAHEIHAQSIWNALCSSDQS